MGIISLTVEKKPLKHNKIGDTKMTNIKMKVSDFKQDDNIHAITHRIGKLAAYTVLQYRCIKRSNGDRFDVYDRCALYDVEYYKTNTSWEALGIDKLFRQLPYSKDKALAKICLFSYATKKEAVAKINEIQQREFEEPIYVKYQRCKIKIDFKRQPDYTDEDGVVLKIWNVERDGKPTKNDKGKQLIVSCGADDEYDHNYYNNEPYYDTLRPTLAEVKSTLLGAMLVNLSFNDTLTIEHIKGERDAGIKEVSEQLDLEF